MTQSHDIGPPVPIFMLMGVVLTLAAWGLSPPTSTPCLCQGLSHLFRSQSHLWVSHWLFFSLSASQPLFLSLQGKGQQQDQLRLFQERKAARSLCPAAAPGKGGGRRWWRSPTPSPSPAPAQVHPAGSWSLALPCSSQAETRPTGPILFPLHLTPSLGLRGECGLTLPTELKCRSAGPSVLTLHL